MVLDHGGEYSSRWSAIASISKRIGCTVQTLNKWVKKAKIDGDRRAGVSAEAVKKI